MATEVSVTDRHIEDGVRCDATNCPVGLALRATYPDAVVTVDSEIIYVDDKYWPTPPVVGKFISNFDSEDEVGPFRFELADND